MTPPPSRENDRNQRIKIRLIVVVCLGVVGVVVLLLFSRFAAPPPPSPPPPSPPPSPTSPFEVGDSVIVDADGPKHACVVKVRAETGKSDLCWKFDSDDGCDGVNYVDDSSLTKASRVRVHCGRDYSECQGIPTMCGLVEDGDYYPGGGQDGNGIFKSKSDCEKHYGTDNTWGKCTDFSQEFEGKFWCLGCSKDSDCGRGRNCVPDGNPLNPLHRVCSCAADGDCKFNNSGPNNTACIRAYVDGTSSCPSELLLDKMGFRT